MSDSAKFAVTIMLIVAIAASVAAWIRGFPATETVEQIPASPSATAYAS